MNNNEMQKNLHKHNSPLMQDFQLDEYFACAGHLKLLTSIRRDIAARIPMIIITGEDGCGKSVIGKMLASEKIQGCVPVYFGKTVDSFEDVVSVLARTIDVEVPEVSRTGIATAMGEIAVGIIRRGKRFLLICDGAERIFLATLERIRKMIDRLNTDDVCIQLVLIGRQGVVENLKQLRICSFEEKTEKRYLLEPLTFSEASSYVAFVCEQLPEADGALFTPEVVDRIYQSSSGNFRKLQNLVKELCNRHGKDASFWVLLENVEGGMAKAGWNLQRHWQSFLKSKSNLSRVFAVGGVVVACGLMLYVFTGSDEKQHIPSEQVNAENTVGVEETQSEKAADHAVNIEQKDDNLVPSVSVVQSIQPEHPAVTGQLPPVVSPADTSETNTVEDQSEIPNATTSTSNDGMETAGENVELMEQPVVTEENKTTEALLAEAQEAVEVASMSEGPSVTELTDGKSSVGTVTAIVPGEKEDAAATGYKERLILSPAQVKKIITPQHLLAADVGAIGKSKDVALSSVIGRGSNVPRILWKEEKKKILTAPVSLAPAETTKHPIPEQMQTLTEGETKHLYPEKNKARISVQTVSKKIPVLNQAILPEKTIAVSGGIYERRVAAGSPWLAGKRNDKFTMQLMVLSSETAPENVNQILTKKEYAGEARRLYVFEKKGTPPTIFVFLGEYDSMAQAEAAKNALPESLRKHKPYIVSVKGAMQKLR